MKTVRATTKQSRSLTRGLNRIGVRDDKSPQVVRKTAKLHEPTVCPGCGATFLHKTWRRDHTLTEALLARIEWHPCPACEQVSRLEGQGRLIIRGTGALANLDTIRHRIQNVTLRAGKTQPEHRITSIDTSDSGGLEVLTTSQKLAHRIVHELKKVYGGHAVYEWSDDGTLFAKWEYDLPKSGRKKARQR